jgi:hypothetical protein
MLIANQGGLMQTVRTLKTPQKAPTPDQAERLAAVARRVAEDARQAPAAYRKETRVPAGGE